MKKRFRGLRGAALLAGMALASTAGLTQSDGSVEETYARQCPQHQQTQLCIGLRAMMGQAAGDPARPYVGIGLQDIEPEMAAELGTVPHVGQRVAQVVAGGAADQAGLRVGDIILSVGGEKISREHGVPDVLATRKVGAPVRFELVRGGQRLALTVTPRARPPEADVPAEDPALARWGALGSLAGSLWQGPDQIWSVKLEEDGEHILVVRYSLEGGDFETARFSAPAAGRIKTKSWDYLGLHESTSTMLPDGGLFYDFTDDAVFPRSRDEFEWVNGRMVGGQFVRSDHQDGPRSRNRSNGLFRRMSDDEAQAFNKTWEAYQRRLVEQKQGNSGLLGAAMMAGGVALAGGNTEQMVGAAMKGAELTTDDENMRQALAGQGDALIASGTQRRIDNSARRSALAGGAAMGSSSPDLAGARQATANPSATAAFGSSGGSPAARSMRYYSCIGTTKKRLANGADGIDTVYYGIVTASRDDIDGATSLFRQQTGSRNAVDTENAGASCSPHNSRNEALAAKQSKIARDSGRDWRQVTNIELTM